jgi:hypothetical protein
VTTTAIEPPKVEASEAPSRHVPLPALDEELLHRTAGGGAVWGDSRRFPRFAAAAEGHLQEEGTFIGAGRLPRSQTVLLRDVSRGGLRFLHGGELFPAERCSVVLPNGSDMRIEVVWCRRMGAGIYMSGCRFFSIAASAKVEGEDKAAGEEQGESEADAAGD